MKTKYKHTNIVSRNWQALAAFYETVFGCVRVPPERHLSGAWLEKGTGVPGARFSGVHLRLPGHGENGLTSRSISTGKMNRSRPRRRIERDSPMSPLR